MLLFHGTSFYLLHLLKCLLMSLPPLHYLESPHLCYTMLNIVYNCVKSKIHIWDILEVIKYTSLFRTPYFHPEELEFPLKWNMRPGDLCHGNMTREKAHFLKWDEFLWTSASSGQLHNRSSIPNAKKNLCVKERRYLLNSNVLVLLSNLRSGGI